MSGTVIPFHPRVAGVARAEANNPELLIWEKTPGLWWVTLFNECGHELGSYGSGFEGPHEAFARAWRARCEDHPAARISINTRGLLA